MRKNVLQLILCYILWGFQPLYWMTLSGFDSFTILGLRTIFVCAIIVFTISEINTVKSQQQKTDCDIN